MKKTPRNQIANEVQTRLNAGKSKDAIYRELEDQYGATATERSLAQWATPEDKEKNRYLNIPLLVIVIVFTLTKIIQFSGIFMELSLSQMVAALLTILIHLYMILGVKNYNLIGYALVFLVAVGSLAGIRSVGAYNAIPLALTVTSVALAWIQKVRIFPNVSLFLRHKRDTDGNILF